MSTRTKLVTWFGAFAASFAGALILLEMFIMISPFILYYYGVYGPVLSLLHLSRWTAWLTAFFLPHLVSFPPMPDLVTVGFLIFVVGVLAFLVNAGQLYYVKLRKKSVAVRGLYARKRHLATRIVPTCTEHGCSCRESLGRSSWDCFRKSLGLRGRLLCACGRRR